jgi:hypothetical protein
MRHRGPLQAASFAAAALAWVAMTALLPGCSAAPGGTPAAQAAQAEQGTVVPGVGTFACVTPRHVCPTRFEPDVRAKACTCHGEPGRFQYYRPEP